MPTDTPHNIVESLLSLPARLRFKVGTRLKEIRYNARYKGYQPVAGSDGTISGIAPQEAALEQLLQRGEFEPFLDQQHELTSRLASEPSLTGSGLYVPNLDQLSQKAGLALAARFPEPKAGPGSRVLLHVATIVYAVGGHTRVIQDIAASLPEYRHILVLTGMDESDRTLPQLKTQLEAMHLEVRTLQSATFLEKSRELSSLVAALGPQAIFLATHHDDSVAAAAIRGDSAPRVFFLHHTDHQPSLGAYRLDFRHVDLTPACYGLCATHPALHASMLNLMVLDMGVVQPAKRETLVGATCGSPHKYQGTRDFSYAQLLAALFAAGVDRLLHIGDMPEPQKEQIRAGIASQGQHADRILFLPNAPSLQSALVGLQPDFFLTSHPIDGGKATVEALSVGLPVGMVHARSAPRLLAGDMTLGAAVPIQDLGQVPAATHRLRSEKDALASVSRQTYERNYSPSAFRRGLLSLLGG